MRAGFASEDEGDVVVGGMNVDIYDLNPNSDAIKSHTNLFKQAGYDMPGLLPTAEKKDMCVGTDFNRK
jgi:hypothetical protein